MYIKGITAENLFSWKNLSIDLDNNRAYSIVGENGCGKSSIFEIIIWVLFKKSTKKSIKGDWGSTDGYGTIVFDSFSVTRETIEPMKIVIDKGCDDESIISQEELNNMLGCSYETFMAANMVSQKRAAAFINEKTDTGKAKIFGEMLGIGILDKKRSKLSKYKNNAHVEYESIKSKIEVLNEERETCKLKFNGRNVKEFIQDIKDSQNKYHKLNDKCQKIQEEYNRATKDYEEWTSWEKQEAVLAQIQESKVDKEKQLRILEKLYVKNKDKYESVNNMLEKCEKILEKLRRDKAYCDSIEYALIKDVDRVVKLINNGGVCDVCLSDISKRKSELSKTQDKLSKELSEATKKRMELSNKIELYKEKYDKLIKIREKKDKYELEIRLLKQSLETDLSKYNLPKPKGTKPDLKTLSDNLNDTVERAFSLKKCIGSRLEVIRRFKGVVGRLKEMKIELDSKYKKYYVAKWLMDRLPYMKLLYIDNNKSVLENLINENLSNMNLPFIVKIDTKKELKSKKEVKDEFSFKIIHSSKSKNVDKSDISGGQEILILLATQFAINDLINPKMNVEIYDEVFGALSVRNIEIVIDLLKERSKKKQLFIVSHKPEISHGFDEIIKIGMKGDYSCVC